MELAPEVEWENLDMEAQAKNLASDFTTALIEGEYDRAIQLTSIAYRTTHSTNDLRAEFDRMRMECQVSRFEIEDFVEQVRQGTWLVHVYLTLDGADPEQLAVFISRRDEGLCVTDVEFGRP